MATVHFSVPSEVKEAFDNAFKGTNKSAALSDLMRRAVKEKQKNRRSKAIAQFLELRKTSTPDRSSRILDARRKGRT